MLNSAILKGTHYRLEAAIQPVAWSNTRCQTRKTTIFDCFDPLLDSLITVSHLAFDAQRREYGPAASTAIEVAETLCLSSPPAIDEAGAVAGALGVATTLAQLLQNVRHKYEYKYSTV